MGLSWPNMASKTTSRASSTLSRASKTPPRASKTAPKRPQEPPRCAQDTPRELPESCFSQCVSIYSTFLGLLGAILLNMAVKMPSIASKTPSRSPREPPKYPHVHPTKSLQAASKSWPPVASSLERGQAPRVVWRWFARVGRLRLFWSFAENSKYHLEAAPKPEQESKETRKMKIWTRGIKSISFMPSQNKESEVRGMSPTGDRFLSCTRTGETKVQMIV